MQSQAGSPATEAIPGRAVELSAWLGWGLAKVGVCEAAPLQQLEGCLVAEHGLTLQLGRLPRAGGPAVALRQLLGQLCFRPGHLLEPRLDPGSGSVRCCTCVICIIQKRRPQNRGQNAELRTSIVHQSRAMAYSMALQGILHGYAGMTVSHVGMQ